MIWNAGDVPGGRPLLLPDSSLRGKEINKTGQVKWNEVERQGFLWSKGH